MKLILEAKEKLLSFETPLRFIFSVWALQEGWDNPNVFTLIKLSSSGEISRHQQVGRGLRLCVNQEGKRINYDVCNEDSQKFYAINSLDVLISDKEKEFIEKLQEEIQNLSHHQNFLNRQTLLNQYNLTPQQADDFIFQLRKDGAIQSMEEVGIYERLKPIDSILCENKEEYSKILGENFQKVLDCFVSHANKEKQIQDANKPKPSVKIRKNLAKDFKELWEAINRKTKITYSNINTARLISEIKTSFEKESITPETIIIETKKLDPQSNQITTEKTTTLSDRISDSSRKRSIHQGLIDFAKEEKYPLSFVLEIYQNLNQENFSKNPKQSLKILKDLIKEKIHSNILSSVSYEIQETYISNDDLIFENQAIKEEIKPYTILGQNLKENQSAPEHYLYEQIVYDSEIEFQTITKDPKKIEDLEIIVFAKLPKFKIPTPYKHYEPDFAYLIQTDSKKKIFLICETKGYEMHGKIPKEERRKIDYAEKFFEALQKELPPEIKIYFKTRIKTQDLRTLLDEITQKENQ